MLALGPLAGRAADARGFDDPAAYCATVRTIDKPDARYTGEAVPDWMAAALMQATGAPATSKPEYFKQAAWRCDGGRVLACSYGANIPCDDKANARRKPGFGEIEFCRENPNADLIPAVAAGHASVYEWRCKDARPVIARQVLKVDRRGFPAAFWYPVAPASR